MANINKQNLTIEFRVVDSEAVDRFMADADMIRFLQDPFRMDAESGCRITITRDGDSLSFARQGNRSTDRPIAYQDLLQTLKTYVLPYQSEVDDNLRNWTQLAGAVDAYPEGVASKVLARGAALLARPEMTAPEEPSSGPAPAA